MQKIEDEKQLSRDRWENMFQYESKRVPKER